MLFSSCGDDDLEGWSGLHEVSFDGNGNATYTSLTDDGAGAVTYNVTSEGVFTAPNPTQRDNYGVVTSDGSMFTFIYKKESDPDVSIKIGIKKSSGMSLLWASNSNCLPGSCRLAL